MFKLLKEKAKKYFLRLLSLKSLKKTPRYAVIVALTLGAVLTLGLLGFVGMLEAFPLILPLALGAFVFAVVYEGEIYSNNILLAFSKLNVHKYISRKLANEVLLKEVKSVLSANDNNDEAANFFTDYAIYVKQLAKYEKREKLAPLKDDERTHKKHIKKQLKNMEKWFADFLDRGVAQESYQQNLADKLGQDQITAFKRKLESKITQFYFALAFAVISGLFMAWGTSFLLSTSLAAIPLFAGFAAAPYIIIPLALVAGIAWGFLTYNAVTDLIIRNTFSKYYQKVKGILVEIFTPDTAEKVTPWADRLLTAGKFLFSFTLIVLTLLLSGFIAATFFSVGMQPSVVFPLLQGTAQFAISIFMSLNVGLSEFFFAVENTVHTLEEFNHTKIDLDEIFEEAYKQWQSMWNNENWLQLLNPFRLVVRLTFTPLLLLLFGCHLISIGVGGDKAPGVPTLVSIILGILSELGVDAHYFIPLGVHDHGKQANPSITTLKHRLGPEHGHSHGNDIPIRILRLVYFPIKMLSVLWDWGASNIVRSPKSLSFAEAWEKHTSPVEIELEQVDGVLINGETDDPAEKVSPDFFYESVLYKLRRFQEAHPLLDKAKKEELSNFTTTVSSTQDKTIKTLHENLDAQAGNPVYQVRFFSPNDKSETQQLLDKLQNLCAPVA